MPRSETDIVIGLLKKLAARKVPVPADLVEEVLATTGPELGVVDAQGRLAVSREMLAPGSAWLRSSRALVNKALAENKLDIVD
jgi:hypothetical protein